MAEEMTKICIPIYRDTHKQAKIICATLGKDMNVYFREAIEKQVKSDKK